MKTPPHGTGRWPRWPDTDHRTLQHLAATLLSGRLAVSGAKSTWPGRGQAAATALATALGRRHAVLTTNGSTAIVVALHALGIGPGDVVLMPATTWVACATAVLRVGARPAFFDATEGSPCGPTSTTDTPSAVLGIHLYAQHCDIAAVREAFPGVPVIEDASHSHFALTASGRRTATLGDLSVLSLQATKLLTCGEGGAVLTDSDEMAARLESLVMDSRRRAAKVAETAPNELEPALLLHGANHAPPELSSALLLDQLARFPAQAETRSRGARAFRAALRGSRWECVCDEAATTSGAFYGLVLRVPEGVGHPASVVEHVHRRTGLVLDTVYPPVPLGPLYRPSTIAQFAPSAAWQHDDFPLSQWWHDRSVVVPHHAFLAPEWQVHDLAEALRELAPSPALRPAVAGRRWGRGDAPPTIEVVVVTNGNRQQYLRRALTSVAQQQVAAMVKVTLVVDGVGGRAAAAASGTALPVQVVEVAATGLPAHPFERVAVLREIAATVVDGDYVAFLDDDNEWEADHLATLLAEATRGFPAVHSWRQLVDGDGKPVLVRRFPWLPPGAGSRERFTEFVRQGVMSPDSPVVRDRVLADGHPSATAMVDMGEWLLERDLLRVVRFHRPRTPEELAERYGEDDVLLEQLIALRVPVGCTRRASLRYRLGGMSCPDYRTASPNAPDAAPERQDARDAAPAT
ncbi:DegT/DnrJ/EryC1/StrS family aminotransferase [Streptoalloteichus hindustanus]|uniref:dTDP-4-amino-4,6-dideoxygalactose transaminase n=1 Tax=Streptoalloteichus hindustanus TaxID=2017 RepID=A0A1M5IGD2_STRHI|nr:DegT/DnrJ/EryC1/StrS family aminotransferase [Streptoalloteichus hindustanus]SHG27362.1 dTDP-4-amino-4,6-dideoxygalactose transaminase [Streptoalloteichus hindustanus]